MGSVEDQKQTYPKFSAEGFRLELLASFMGTKLGMRAFFGFGNFFSILQLFFLNLKIALNEVGNITDKLSQVKRTLMHNQFVLVLPFKERSQHYY